MTAPRIAYFVHDTSHADIWRRVQMFDRGGASTTLIGFRRRAAPDPNIADRTVDLGQTADGAFAKRALAVAKARARMEPWADVIRAADVILARNLEMLVLADAARRRYAPDAALISECLDIHRLIAGDKPIGRALRGMERRLLQRCDGLVVSSPGFVREHFAKRYGDAVPPVVLLENKVFLTGDEPPRAAQTAPAGPPWRIGWYGIIRCKTSFDILAGLAAKHPGLIEVIIAGRPAEAVFGPEGEGLKGAPGITYRGGFRDEAELAELFRTVNFAWAIDYYEAGGNSDWLLPNRLYRALLYGAAPIASSGVETGRWLKDRGVGVLLDEPVAETLEAALLAMTPERLETLKADIAAVPTDALAMDDAACAALVEELAGLRVTAGV